ncbi:MAG TPA: LLM class flavin-dependent oxidoreductase [Chloroflexota bacterium]|nr:LLM class flavin-dependent oxidoreductase [Chloroflexota bacterium]
MEMGDVEIGIGLPAAIPGVNRAQLLGWARGADQRGFSTLGVIDRLVYPNIEPLSALTAAAAVTERIRLTTAILLAPLRANGALFAKQAASLQILSEGRLVLGLAAGARQDDFDASALDFHTRGRRFNALLEDIRRIWEGEARGFAGAIGPDLGRVGPPPILVGGTSDAAIRRAARYGTGWIAGGGGPEAFAASAQKVRDAWSSAGRDGPPRLAALAYFALGTDARAHADRYLKDYYAFGGPYAERVASSALVDDAKIRAAIAAFQEAGCDELILFPCNPDPSQVDLLAGIAL